MFCILLALCSLLAVWKWFKKPDPSEPPELSGKLPVVGHGLLLLGDSVKMFDNFHKISLEAVEKGGVGKLYLGPRMCYVIIDPEDCNTLMTECIKKHYMYDFARPLLTNGLLNADVPTWKKHRKLLNPAFSQHVIDGFLELFNAQAKKLVNKFAEEVGKQFDHDAYIRLSSLETICATSFGASPEYYEILQMDYLPLMEELLHIFNMRLQKFWLHDDFIYNWSSLKKRQDELVERLNKFSDTLIEKKRSEMPDSTTENKSGKLKPFIDLIIKLSKDHPSMTDWQIRGETSTIVLAGHDTTSTALSVALTLLGSYPQVLEKAYQEILQVFGNSRRDVLKEDLSKLVYVEAIAKETLRLYPSAPVIARELDKDIKLKNCTLKDGHGCFISVYSAHRHPIWGPDANDFRPERWFEKDTLPQPKYYGAFGLGRRTCIGKTYAMMFLKTLLTHMIRSYRISADISNTVFKMDSVLKFEGGYITLEHRHLPR